MKKENLISFRLTDYTDEIREVMSKKRYRDFPILDKQGCYVGMISRRNLLGVRKRAVILVDHNEITQAVDNVQDSEILEIIDHHRIGSLETMAPVYFRNQPVGCTATIVAQMYQEKGGAGSAFYRGTALRRDPVRYADVPFAYLHGGRPERGQSPGGDRGHPVRGFCPENVCGGQQPAGQNPGGNLLPGF